MGDLFTFKETWALSWLSGRAKRGSSRIFRKEHCTYKHKEGVKVADKADRREMQCPISWEFASEGRDTPFLSDIKERWINK